MVKVFIALILFLFYACGGNSESNKSADKPKELNDLSKKELSLLLDKYPDSIPLLQKRAELSLDSLDYPQLMKDAAHAFRLDSNNTTSRLLYALALINKDKNLIQSSDFSTACYHFSKVLQKDTSELKALVGMGSVFANLGNYDQAFVYVNKALRINPKYRDAYVLKGSMYLSKQNFTLAKSSYETAIKQDSKFFLGHLILGSIYEHENSPLCIEYYTTAYQLEPKNPEIIYALAYANEKFDRVKEAKRLYRLIAKVDSTYEIGYFHLGDIKQFKEKDLDSALFFYSEAIEINPKHIESYHNAGLAYEGKKQISNALFMYRKALEINPNYNITLERVNALGKRRS
ncbi:MAG: hypothetical protein RL110_1823 [Bacteroidota bacterium]|jgi:tetratricopeptide (TPR) repeat protein